MKRISLFLTLVLAACSAQPPVGPRQTSLQEQFKNPLVADRYWSETAEHMADFTRHKNPILKDGVKAAIIEEARQNAIAQLEQVRAGMAGGMEGGFLSAGEPVVGRALLLGNTLSFGSEFLTFPTPSMRVYLTTLVDPRGITFPDSTAISLGELQVPYGAQEYTTRDDLDPKIRTVVLYDTQLERVYGFAQLSK